MTRVRMPAKLVLMVVAAVISVLLCGCGGGGGAGAPTIERAATVGSTQRSARLANVHNWRLVNPNDRFNPALLQQALENLAKRDNVAYTEHMEYVNATDGWAKLSSQTLRSLHPDIRIYRWYDLCVKCAWDTDWQLPRASGFLAGDRLQTPMTWAVIDQMDWWLRDGNGQIVKEGEYIWFLDVGKPGFKEAYLQGVLDRLQGQGFDGVTFDYLWPDLSGLFRILGCPMPVDYPTDNDWFEKAWKPFFSYVMDGVHAAGYRIIGNCAGEYGYCSPERAFQRSKLDGTIYEQLSLSFINQGADWLPGSTIERRIKELSSDPLETWTSDAATPSDPEYDQKQKVSLAVYYIGVPQSQEKRSYHHMYDETSYWQPIWDFSIGTPAQEADKMPGKYFWSRKYTGGIVLLNYESNESISYNLDRPYHDSAGKQFSGSVVLPPHTALILAQNR